MDRSSQAELIGRILDGETDQFAEIVRAFDARVRSVITSAVRDPNEQEELVQQTFYLAFTRLETLRDVHRFEAWIARIAANSVVDHHRQRARWKELSRGLSHRAQPAERREAWIWEEVSVMPPAFRDVLVLRYRANCTYQQIAAKLSVPVSTVRGRIYEARRELRRRLGEGGLAQ